MKKYAAVIAICLVALMTVIAFAGAIKVDLLPNPGTGYGMGGGQAIINYAKGADKTEIQVNCWGLTPGTVYHVKIGPVGGPWEEIGTFTAKNNGKGHIHGSLPGDMRVTSTGAIQLVSVNLYPWVGGNNVLIDQRHPMFS